MSRAPLARCLILCLLALAPAEPTRADDGGPSTRRKAEIDALIARRGAAKENRARGAANRNAEAARRLSEARAYEIQVAQALASYQMSVERQADNERYWWDRATRSMNPQSYCTPSASTVGLGFPAYTSGPVYVSYNPPPPINPSLSFPAPTAGAGHPFPAHFGGPFQAEQALHAANHMQTAVLQAHTR